MIFLQICLSLIYGFLINVQSLQLNVGSVIVTIGLAILVIAGTSFMMQDLDLFLDIQENSYGVESDLRFSSQLYALKSIL